MNLIMGIGPEIQLSADIKKTLRVGTVKQIKEVGELYREGLKTVKSSVFQNDEESIGTWVEILDMVCVEGFTREEFDNSIPGQVEDAVSRFLFG